MCVQLHFKEDAVSFKVGILDGSTLEGSRDAAAVSVARVFSTYVVTNFISHLTNFRRSVLGCTSYGARPQARAVNLSLTPRKQVRIGWLLTRSAGFAGFAGWLR